MTETPALGGVRRRRSVRCAVTLIIGPFGLAHLFLVVGQWWSPADDD